MPVTFSDKEVAAIQSFFAAHEAQLPSTAPPGWEPILLLCRKLGLHRLQEDSEEVAKATAGKHEDAVIVLDDGKWARIKRGTGMARDHYAYVVFRANSNASRWSHTYRLDTSEQYAEGMWHQTPELALIELAKHFTVASLPQQYRKAND